MIIILYVIYIEVITVAKMSDSKLIYKGNTYMHIYVERNNYDFDKLLGFVSEGFLLDLLPVPKGLRMQLYRTENGKNDFFVLARSSSPKLYCKVEKIKELQNDNFLSDALQPQLENGTVTQIKINGENTDINISEDVDFIIEQSNNEKTVSLLDGEIKNAKYSLNYYFNDTCIFREGAKILVRNGQYLFVDMSNGNWNGASIISDESALESIKVDGVQVFNKK